MNFSNMKATTARLLLSIGLFVIVGAAITMVYFATSNLKTFAADVSARTAEKEKSSSTVEALQKTEQELKIQQSSVERAKQVVADSEKFNYQNQLIDRLTAYAGTAGIGITTITFSSNAPTAGAAASSGVADVLKPVSGLSTANVAITLSNPINFVQYVTFLNLIEQSLPSLQVTNISVTKDQSGVTSGVLNVGVYIK